MRELIESQLVEFQGLLFLRSLGTTAGLKPTKGANKKRRKD